MLLSNKEANELAQVYLDLKIAFTEKNVEIKDKLIADAYFRMQKMDDSITGFTGAYGAIGRKIQKDIEARVNAMR